MSVKYFVNLSHHNTFSKEKFDKLFWRENSNRQRRPCLLSIVLIDKVEKKNVFGAKIQMVKEDLVIINCARS